MVIFLLSLFILHLHFCIDISSQKKMLHCSQYSTISAILTAKKFPIFLGLITKATVKHYAYVGQSLAQLSPSLFSIFLNKNCSNMNKKQTEYLESFTFANTTVIHCNVQNLQLDCLSLTPRTRVVQLGSQAYYIHCRGGNKTDKLVTVRQIIWQI